MMGSAFWWGSDIPDLLFKGLAVNGTKGIIIACVCVALLSFFFEWFKYIQAKQRQIEIILRSKQIRAVCRSDSVTQLTARTKSRSTSTPLHVTTYFRIWFCLGKLGIWVLLTNIGYSMMLIVMIYNGWLFLSALIGGAIGYFAFGQMFMKINLENCRIIRDSFCANPFEPDSIPSTGDGESTPALEHHQPSTSTDAHSASSCHNIAVTVNVHVDNNLTSLDDHR